MIRIMFLSLLLVGCDQRPTDPVTGQPIQSQGGIVDHMASAAVGGFAAGAGAAAGHHAINHVVRKFRARRGRR